MDQLNLVASLINAQYKLNKCKDIGVDTVDSENTIINATLPLVLGNKMFNPEIEQLRLLFSEKTYLQGAPLLHNYWMPVEYMQLLRWSDSWESFCKSIANRTMPDIRDIARHLVNVMGIPFAEQEDDSEEVTFFDSSIFYITLRIPGQEEVGCYVDWESGLVGQWLAFKEEDEEPIAIITTQHLIYDERFPDDIEIRIYKGLEAEAANLFVPCNYPQNGDTPYVNFSHYVSAEEIFTQQCHDHGEREGCSDHPEMFLFGSPNYFAKDLDGKDILLDKVHSAPLHHLLDLMNWDTHYALVNLDDRYYIVSRMLGVSIVMVPEDYLFTKFEKARGKWVEPKNTDEFPFTATETVYFEYMLLETNIKMQMTANMEQSSAQMVRQTGKQPLSFHCMVALEELLHPKFGEETDGND